MNKEIYLWVIFFVAIAGGVLYLRYAYTPSIGVSVAINSSGVRSIYPYQSLTVPVQVENTGGAAIKDMGIAVLVNGNQSSYYTVTLPSGKSTSFDYNFSSAAPGTYNISVVADPGRVYNIPDRKGTVSSASIDVLGNQSAEPFLYLPSANATSRVLINSDLFGFEVLTYLKSYYNITMPEFLGSRTGFLTPLLDLTYQYLRNISVGYYGYANGSYAYMLMLRGYLSPGIVGVAAEAENLSTYNTTAFGMNVTHVKLNQNTTLCSWYSGGWLDSLLYSGNADCISILANRYNAAFYNPYNSISENLLAGGANASKDLAYTFISGNAFLLAAVGKAGPTIYIPTVERSNASSGVCFGVISAINGSSYCSEIALNESGGTGKNVSVLKSMELTSEYNATLLTIFNSSKLYATVPEAIGVIDGMNLKGTPVAFTSGISSSCSFLNSFGCGNVSFASGKLDFKLTSLLNYTASVSSISCYSAVRGIPMSAALQLAPKESAAVSVACYNGTSLISGIPLGLKLNLLLNYTANGSKGIAVGSAYIPIGQ